MSKSKHTEAQMIAALKQVEAGRKVEDVARECGVFQHTIYAWKAKYGGMDVTEAQEAKQLRDREHPSAEAGSGFEFGQGSAAVGDSKKTDGARSDEGSCRACATAVRLQRAASVRALMARCRVVDINLGTRTKNCVCVGWS